MTLPKGHGQRPSTSAKTTTATGDQTWAKASNLDSSSDWLPFYASVFNYVEIDSSFYKTRNLFTVKNWINKTPDKALV
jgi:uncharacterized protein YecE (DUF72 family)